MRTKEQQQYLSNLACTMLQQLRVPEQYGESPDVGAVFRDFSTKIRIKVAEMTPETRGRIAELGLSDDDHSGISMFHASGIGNLNCRVHGGSWLIIELATMTIAAMMYEVLCAGAYELHRMDAELELEFDELNRRHRIYGNGPTVAGAYELHRMDAELELEFDELNRRHRIYGNGPTVNEVVT